MLKRINWKGIFKVFAWLICLASLTVLMSFIAVKKHEVKCSNVEILIPGSDNFIEREEIDAILKQEHGQLIGRNLNLINIHDIEKALQANPYIAFAKIYIDMDGTMRIEVKQRQPVLRILNAGGQDFYIDKNGLKMPMSPNFTAKVLVANGNILEGFGGKVDTLFTPLARDLYKAALFFKNDQLWDSQIEQIYVNSKNDIELIPRVGNQRIILGNADSLQVKMNNLLAFYKQAMPKVGWAAYKTINLKYTNQIVCEKFDSLQVKKAIKQFTKDSASLVLPKVEDLIKSAIEEENKNNKVQNKVSKPVVKDKVIEKPTVKPVEKSIAKPASAAPIIKTTVNKNTNKTATKNNKQ